MSPIDISHTHDVLQRFRASKSSAIVRKIRNKMLESLQGEDYFNGRITHYFANPIQEKYPFHFKSIPEVQPLPAETSLGKDRPTLIKRGKEFHIYGNTTGSIWKYTLLSKPYELRLKSGDRAARIEENLLYLETLADGSLQYTLRLRTDEEPLTDIISKADLVKMGIAALGHPLTAEDLTLLLTPKLADMLVITLKRGQTFDNDMIEKVLKDAKVNVDADTDILQSKGLDELYEQIIVKVAHSHQAGQPYAGFGQEPAQVEEIKKIINALYYLEIVFRDVENNGYYVTMNYATTRVNASKASQLLNLSVGVAGAFGSEVMEATQLLGQLYGYAQQGLDMLPKANGDFVHQSLAYKAGFVSGVAVDQMQPTRGGNLDYDFLTHFTAVLPGYIDNLTNLITKYTVQSENGATLNEQKLKELQGEGLQLLNSIEKIQTGGSFGTLKLLHYVYLVGHVINLSTEILGQTGLLNETAQDAIRNQLHFLKYEILPNLFTLTDKIEVQFMLNPGVLSIPLMKKINRLYDCLIDYVKTPVNFSAKGESLLKLEDTDFIALRVASVYRQIDESEDAIFKINLAREELAHFSDLLSAPEYNDKRLIDLPQELKETLLGHLKFFEPYLAQLSQSDKTLDRLLIDSPSAASLTPVGRSLNELLIDNLTVTTTRIKWFYDYTVGRAYNMVYADESLVSNIKSKLNPVHGKLAHYLNKLQESHALQINISQDIIHSVGKEAALVLFPYHRENSIYVISEASALTKGILEEGRIQFSADPLNSIVTNPEQLTIDESRTLYNFYKNKQIDLNKAELARETLLALLSEKFRDDDQIVFGDQQEALKKQCRELYGQIQPYLIGTYGIQSKEVLLFDKAVVSLLSGCLYDIPNKDKKKVVKKITPSDFYTMMDGRLLGFFEAKKETWGLRKDNYNRQVLELHRAAIVNTKLDNQHNSGARAAYLIKHSECSKQIGILKAALSEWTGLLSEAVREKLNPATEGVPFPEVNDVGKMLTESNQILAFKRVANFFYNTEMLLLELEAISDDEWTEVKIQRILGAVGYTYELYTLGTSLSADPYFSFIYRDMMTKVHAVTGVFFDKIKPFSIGADQIEPLGKPAEIEGLWYSLNALALLPDEIDVLTKESRLSPSEKEEKTKQIQIASKQSYEKIEHIINHANSSYLKLILLDGPFAYPLFKELQGKIKTFTGKTHKGVMGHIDEINSVLFADMLLEIDLWETNLGLNPGTLTEPLQEILDEYYDGLVKPLGFDFKTQEKLICNLTPIRRRLDAELTRYNKALVQYHELNPRVAAMDELVQLVKHRSVDVGGNLLVVPAYVNAIPLIKEFQAYCKEKHIALPTTIADFNNCRYPAKGKALDDLIKLMDLCKNYQEGLIAPHQLAMDAALAKIVHLDGLKLKKIQNNQQFRLTYAQDFLAKKTDSFCTRSLGLFHLEDEYNSKLRKHLLSHQAELLESVRTSQAIDVDLNRLLMVKVGEFEAAHIKDYYQLDAVLEAAHQFKVYLAHAQDANRHFNSPQENKNLDDKNKFIKALETLGFDPNIPLVSDRLDAIKDIVDKRGQAVLTSYDHENGYNLKWLKQRIVALFVSCGLYTTKRRVHFTKLYQSIAVAPKMDALTDRFSLVKAPVAPDVVSVPLHVEVNPDLLPVHEEMPFRSIRDFLSMTPQVLRALSDQFGLNQGQADALIVNMQHALTLADTIFRETPNSNDLRLFFARTSTIELTQSLENKFELFTGKSDKETLKHLSELNRDIFTQLLLAADTEEYEQGFMPGHLSTPIKRALDQFYSQLIMSLNIDYKTREQFIYNPDQTKQRNDAMLERLEKNMIESVHNKANRVKIDKFESLSIDYNRIYSHRWDISIDTYGFADTEDNFDLIKQQLSAAFQEIVPLLNMEKYNVPTQPIDVSFISASMENNQIFLALDAIRGLVEDNRTYYSDRELSSGRKLAAAKSDLIYLHQLQSEANTHRQQSRNEHAHSCFTKHHDTLRLRPLGLNHFDAEYRDKLSQYLLSVELPIILSATKTDQVDEKLHALILKKVKKFETEHIKNYHELDRVMAAILELNAYLNTCDDVTEASLQYVQGLREIAQNNVIPAEERFQILKQRVADDGENTLLNDPAQNRNVSTFAYFVQCIIHLLEALNLYTPAKKAHYQKLSNALEKPLNIGELTKRFGLFYDPKVLPEEPDDAVPTDAPNV